MSEDYYKILGIQRDSSQADIQKAYRELARKYHPDLNPDDAAAKKKFQEVQKAFEVLNDASKREMYDRYGAAFESAAGGGPAGARGWSHTNSGEGFDFSQFFGGEGGAGPDLGDIFSQFSRSGRGSRRRAQQAPAATDLSTELEIPFTTSVTGGNVQLALQHADRGGETLSVKIPPGVDSGRRIRLRGQGSGPKKARGDLLITIRVKPHPNFSRRGDNLYVRTPVALAEAVLGASIDIPTPRGVVAVRVPPGTSSGTKLRVRGHGVQIKDKPPGDLFAEILIQLPATQTSELRDAVRAIPADDANVLRRDLKWE